MTNPDRLDQVLLELELAEQTIGTGRTRSFVRFGDVLLANHRLLRAKLRAAVEMEKAFVDVMEYDEANPKPGLGWRTVGRNARAALAAWEQAGENAWIQ